MVLAAGLVKLLRKYSEPVIASRLLMQFMKSDKRRTPRMFENAMIFLYAMDHIAMEDGQIMLINRNKSIVSNYKSNENNDD